MSRCFPFPPPGYEKKFRTEDADSLIKENHKEKKHKKEKKDKERSKDKHKERKEKKEKHKDRKEKDGDKEKSRTSEVRKAAVVLPKSGDKEKLVTNTLQSNGNGNGESKFIQDLARRIRDEEEATGSQSPQFHSGAAENNNSYPVPQRNQLKVDEKRVSNHKNSDMAKRSESAVLQVASFMDQKRAEVITKPVGKKDQAEKNKPRESVIKSDKPLNKGVIKKSEPKHITDRSSKEKKKDKTKVMNKNVEDKPKFVEGGPRLKQREHNVVDARDFRVLDLSKPGVKNVTAERILGQREDLVTNGLLYENGSRTNQIHVTVDSSMSSVENGSKLGAYQTHQKLPKPVYELQETVSTPEVKEHKVNGFIYSQELKCHPQDSAVKVIEIGEASARKRPHPDSKYLDQLLNVPKREDLHGVDDDEQEWLFGQCVKLLKKQRVDYGTSVVENSEVWNQALTIESADIVALPYVVPY